MTTFKVIAARVGWPMLRDGEVVTAWSGWRPTRADVQNEIAANGCDNPSVEVYTVCPICGQNIIQPVCWFSTWKLQEHVSECHSEVGHFGEMDFTKLIPTRSWIGEPVVLSD